MANTKWAVIGGILLILFVAGILLVPKVQESGLQGFAVLSLSKVEFESQTPFFNKPLFALSIVQSGLGQSAHAEIQPTDSKYASSDKPSDFKVTKKLVVDAKYVKNECLRDINQSSRIPLYNIYETSGNVLLSGCRFASQDSLRIKGAELCGSNQFISGIVDNCILYVACGQKLSSATGNFGSANKNTVTDITATVDGVAVSSSPFRIDTLSGRTEGFLAPNVAYVKWQGNFDTGKACPIPLEIIPIYYNGKWNRLAQSKYDSYLESYTLLRADVTSLRSFRNNLNDASVLAKDAENSIQADSTLSGPSNAGKQIIEMQQVTSFPAFTLYIDALKIGIYQPTPKLEIISASSNCFELGKSGSINVNVENTGNERGCGEVYAICDTGFKSERVSFCLEPNKETLQSLPLTGVTSEKELKGNCQVQLNYLGNVKTKDVDVCVTAPCLCNPYTEGCNGLNRVKCSADCTKYEFIETCKNGCETKADVSSCKGESVKCGEFILPTSFEDLDTISKANAQCDDKNKCTTDTCGLLTKSCKYEFDKTKAGCGGGVCEPLLKFPESFLGFVVLPSLNADCLGTLGAFKLIGSLILAIVGLILLARYFKNNRILADKGKKRSIARPLALLLIGLVTFILTQQVFWYGVVLLVAISIIFLLLKYWRIL